MSSNGNFDFRTGDEGGSKAAFAGVTGACGLGKTFSHSGREQCKDECQGAGHTYDESECSHSWPEYGKYVRHNKGPCVGRYFVVITLFIRYFRAKIRLPFQHLPRSMTLTQQQLALR